jgi:acetyl esterase/lipase
MLNDAARAVRWVRAHADDYKIDPKRVGIMGSSAGGHLASTLLTHFDSGDTNSTDVIERQSSRPDIGIFVIRSSRWASSRTKARKKIARQKSVAGTGEAAFQRIAGDDEHAAVFHLWTTFEDKTVPMENTLLFAEALRKNHVPFDLHIYQKGGHGMGLGNRNAPFAHASVDGRLSVLAEGAGKSISNHCHRRWLGRNSPLRGCSSLAALAKPKIPSRSSLCNFQKGS